MRDFVAKNKVDIWWVTAEIDLCLPTCRCTYTNTDTSFHLFPKAQHCRPSLQCLGLWRRLKVRPRALFKSWYYHSNDCGLKQWMAQIAYSQRHNTVINYIPGTDCHGRKSCHFSPLLLVSLGKRVWCVRKASGSHIPHENRKSTDTIMETRVKRGESNS